MANCEHDAGGRSRCREIATHQLERGAVGLLEVVPRDAMAGRLACFCIRHACEMARMYNDEAITRATNAHRYGLHGTDANRVACVYCAPDEKRRLRIVETSE